METQRTPISRKMRFDVFKRDGFKCMYCGKVPPNAILEADHITPVCKGGKNRMDNLVTACFECNRGKGGVELSVVPESLAEKAARIKESESQLKAFRKVIDRQRKRIEQDAWTVIHSLYGSTTDSIAKTTFSTVMKFIGKLPYESVLYAADTASVKFPWNESRRLKYFCGICWNMIKGDQE